LRGARGAGGTRRREERAKKGEKACIKNNPGLYIIAVYINIGFRSMEYINIICVMTFRNAFRIFHRRRHTAPTLKCVSNKGIHLPHILTISLPLMFRLSSRVVTSVVSSSHTQKYFITHIFNLMI